MSSRILVVEDDERIRSSMRLALEGEGYEVDEAASGEDALDRFAAEPSDVALIDLMLPGMDGFECCRALRRHSAVPIIIVTARTDTHDVVAGLEAGADDYVTKPFALRELTARIRAAVRRGQTSTIPATTPIRIGEIELDPQRRRVQKSGQPIHFTPKEFDLLHYLMSHPGFPITHHRLLSSVWGPEYGNELEYLRTFIRQLRKKLEDDPASPRYLLTDAYVGYRFSERYRDSHPQFAQQAPRPA